MGRIIYKTTTFNGMLYKEVMHWIYNPILYQTNEDHYLSSDDTCHHIDHQKILLEDQMKFNTKVKQETKTKRCLARYNKSTEGMKITCR